MEKYDEVATVFDQIFDTGSSDAAYEQYTSVLGPSSMTETAEGETINRKTATEGFTVYCANRKFADELPLTNEAIDDNQKIRNFLKTWAQGLGEAARSTKETSHADIFNKGGIALGDRTFNNDVNNVLSTGYGNLCYDSKSFLNLTGDARTAKSGKTYYNGVEVLNLNETNLQTLFQLITVTNAYNEAGRRISLRPNVLIVQLGSNNWFTAKRILESPSMVSGAHSGIENLWKGELRLIGWPFLTDSDAWFLGTAKQGLMSLARKPLTIDYYEDKPTDSQIVRGRTRFGKCVRNFRSWAGANFSTT